jgi:nucleotide-binding universal stress UspA family protein
MIVLAHDGSIYGDWVARYAVGFAAVETDRKLLVLHVAEGKVSNEVVDSRLTRLGRDCASLGIEFRSQILPLGKSTYRSLRQSVPHDPQALLICGTRVKPRRQNYLSGSVAEQLLRMHQCPVLALRVVQPGLLGNPHDLLLPLAGHLGGFSRIWPVFGRLCPFLHTVYLFRSLYVNQLHHPYLSSAREQALKEIGIKYLIKISSEMEEQLGPLSFRIDRRVAISADWVNDVLVLASRLKVQIMLLGVSERNLAHRVLHGAAMEKVLRNTSCDVGIYRGP